MQNAARKEFQPDFSEIHPKLTANERVNQEKQMDLPLPFSPPSTDWSSGDGQVVPESAVYPAGVSEGSCSVRVSSQCRRILHEIAAETLQPSPLSTLLFQVVSFLRFSYGSSCGGIIKANPPFAVLNDFSRCLLCLFLKHLQNHNGIIIDAVHNTPRFLLIIDTEFMTSRTN
jgi:hypothetical protein